MNDWFKNCNHLLKKWSFHIKAIFVVPFPKVMGIKKLCKKESWEQSKQKANRCQNLQFWWQQTYDTWHLTPDAWHLTPETWNLTPDTWHMISFLFDLLVFVATVCTCQDSQCLQYAGFFQKKGSVYWKYTFL